MKLLFHLDNQSGMRSPELELMSPVRTSPKTKKRGRQKSRIEKNQPVPILALGDQKLSSIRSNNSMTFSKTETMEKGCVKRRKM